MYFQICFSHWQGLRDICLRGWGLGSSAVQQVVSEIRCFIPLLYPLDQQYPLDPLDQLYPQIDTTPGPSPLLELGSCISSFKLAPGQQEDLNTEDNLQNDSTNVIKTLNGIMAVLHLVENSF